MSSTLKMLRKLAPELGPSPMSKPRDLTDRSILNNPLIPGAVNYNASAENALRTPEHNGPTKQTGIVDFQGGVIPDSPTTDYIQRVTGSGYTGGWSGGPLTNSIGYFDRGNWAGQRNAGIPDKDAKGLYAKLYATQSKQTATAAAERKAEAELIAEKRTDVYGIQSDAEATPPIRSMAAPAA